MEIITDISQEYNRSDKNTMANNYVSKKLPSKSQKLMLKANKLNKFLSFV